MFNLKALFTRALLALTLACGAGAALAGPTYHVTLNTAEFDGTVGYLDLLFLAEGSAAPATATFSNFVGNFGAAAVLEGDASGSVGTGVILGNTTGFNDFLQAVNFGGLFSFDVRFDADAGVDGSTLSIALFNEAFDSYLGAAGNLAEFALLPGAADDVRNLAGDIVTISVAADVPEPDAWMLMALGLLLLAYTLRRQAAR
ncbi:MAG TPA: NF038129 family PEP-CTERM protein [Telluria sp.]